MLVPFPTGIPVKGKDLVGRTKELSQIIELTSHHQSVVLIGPRKYGKTSLLLEALDGLRLKNFLTARVDIFDTSTKRELGEAITEAVLSNEKMPVKGVIKSIKSGLMTALKQIEIKQVINDFEFILGFADPKVDEDDLFDNALDFPQEFAGNRGKHLIFAFDEFGDLAKLNGDSLIKKMRARFQLQDNVTYIFTGSQESLMEQLFASRHQAFFRFGRILYLAELPGPELEEYIIKTFRELGFYIEKEAAREIITRSNAHPYYAQLLCQLIYFSLKGERDEIKLKDVEECFIQAVFSEKSYFDQLWLDLMASRHLLPVLKDITLKEGYPYKEGLDQRYLSRALSSLEKKGLIKRISRGYYQVRDPLFREYIRMREEGVF